MYLYLINCTIVYRCVGQACSMASLLLAAGTPGMRYSLPNSRIMIHQPSGGAQVKTNWKHNLQITKLFCISFKGQATDIQIQAEEILKLKKQINNLYVQHTGAALDKIEKSMERDYFMSPNEAQEFGIIDKVLVSPPIQKNSTSVTTNNTNVA